MRYSCLANTSHNLQSSVANMLVSLTLGFAIKSFTKVHFMVNHDGWAHANSTSPLENHYPKLSASLSKACYT